MWTPLPPQRSGIADHNLALLAELAELADVSVVVDDGLADQVLAPPGAEVVRRSEADRDPTQLAVYHMGNHHPLHRWIHDALLARPGMVVLHDPSLVDFYAAYHEGSAHGFDDEVRLNHGALGHPLPRLAVGGALHLDRLALQLARRVVDASLAVVVHSAWARDVLARQFPHKPVHHIDLAAPVVPDEAAGPDIRHRCGWGAEHVVFGTLGGLWQHKRPELVAKIFAALHPLRPRARLLVAGRAEDTGAMGRMADVLSGAGVEPAVAVLTDVDDEEFTACVSACDVVMDLRWPTAGETSATVMQAFGAGRPAIVSDLPQHAALDGEFCWRVPIRPPEAAGAALDVMLAVAADPGRARRAGRRARAFVREKASFEQVARRYAEVAREVAAGSGRAPLVPRPPASRPDRPPPVRVHATGRSVEGGRLTLQALTAAGIAAAAPHEPAGPQEAGVDLWLLDDGDDRHVHRGPRLTVAAWRGDDPSWAGVAARTAAADETWVASRFVRQAAVAEGAARVAVVPGVVDTPLPPGSSRRDYDLPDDTVVFLARVEAGWPVGLQNPSAAVEAFARAFPPPERGTTARLVVLVERALEPATRSALDEAVVAAGGRLVQWERGSGDAYARGLVGAADVYVSLHRATAFGRTMAEAMYLGKPVIATGYSGNLDFMTPDNSCLVGYSMTRPGAGPPWAEPDLDQAGCRMRDLVADPDRRRRVGASAAATIRRAYGVEAVGLAMATRLDALSAAGSTGTASR